MNQIEKIYQRLKHKYGKEKGQWRLWCKKRKTLREKEEIIIGAILAQRTNWKNVELAIKNLKKEKIYSLKDIYKIGVKKLASLIKPSGFYKIKARYLFNLAKFIIENYGDLTKMEKEKTGILRGKLLSLRGIGYETADTILLYALEKPIFVIDEYTRRLVKKEKLAKDLSYHHLQKIFEENLPKNHHLYQDFHALIVMESKDIK